MQMIYQKDPKGCWIACIAMITGYPYMDIRELMQAKYIERGSGHDGIAIALAYLGYAVAPKARGYGYPLLMQQTWPPKPWADVHICEVAPKRGETHAVIMLRDGKVFDPMWGLKQLEDYEEIFMVSAVYKFEELPQCIGRLSSEDKE